MSVTLVHEWLTNLSGSEKVVEELRRVFPGAPVCTTMRFGEPFASWNPVRTTGLQRFANGSSAHLRVLPAIPAAWKALPLPEADVYVTSFHTFALHARVPTGAPHLVYCHTPPRFLWRRQQLKREGRGLVGPAMALAGSVLRPWDRTRSRRPTQFLANSSAIADRIAAAYGREATVVHPPVDVERFGTAAGGPKGDYFVFFSRLVPYKRADLAIAAFAELGWPLVIAGDGRDRPALERAAPPNVRFAGRVPDDELPALLAGARGMVFPGEEDFGLAPIEAMAAGTPIIAFAAGGALDYVEEGRNGVLFQEQTVASLTAALRRADREEWSAAEVAASAARFRPERFAQAMEEQVERIQP